MKAFLSLFLLTSLLQAASIQEQADAFFARGEAAEKRGDTKLAEVCFQLALRAQPGHAGATEHLKKTAILPAGGTNDPKVSGKLIYPKIQFNGATMDEAVEFLRVKSREIDPVGRGVDFILAPDSQSTATISLDLLRVTLEDAVRYCCELAGLAHRWENGRVLITSKARAGQPLPEVPLSPGTADLARWVLPRLQSSGAGFQQIMDSFRASTAQADPFSKGIRHEFRDAQGKPVDAKTFSPATVSLELNHISAHEALRYISLLTGAVIRVENDLVILQPADITHPKTSHATQTRLVQLEAEFKRAGADAIEATHQKTMQDLKAKYLAAVKKGQVAARQAGKPVADALQEEESKISVGGDVPAEDDSNTADELKKLRRIYRSEAAKAAQTRASSLKPLLDRYDAELAAMEASLAAQPDDLAAVKAARERITKGR